jgi:hypothetical protein
LWNRFYPRLLVVPEEKPLAVQNKKAFQIIWKAFLMHVAAAKA